MVVGAGGEWGSGGAGICWKREDITWQERGRRSHGGGGCCIGVVDGRWAFSKAVCLIFHVCWVGLG